MNQELFDAVLAQWDCVVVYFSSPSCGVCHSLKPKVIDLASEYENLQVLDVDISQNQEIANSLSVFSAPTVIVFLCGKESGRFSRSFGVHQICDVLDRYYEIFAKVQ